MSVNIVEKTDDLVKVNRVLISVSDKRYLEDFIPQLVETNPDVKILSTGGTYAKLEQILGAKSGSHVMKVSDYTGQPETQGGLVKTLDFKIYLGLLTETHNDSHQSDLARTGAEPIDMVIVNLYPFQQTVAKADVTVEQARSNIDIGGPCMIRASAKNYLRVASVVDPEDYGKIIGHLQSNGGSTSLELRFELAKKAFGHTADYDGAISEYLETRSYPNAADCYQLM